MLIGFEQFICRNFCDPLFNVMFVVWVQPQNRNKIFKMLVGYKLKKSQVVINLSCILHLLTKHFFVAPDAHQQHKSGPQAKKGWEPLP